MKEKKNKKIPENKITRIHFGDSDPMDDQMDEFLKEEMMREADEMEARLNSDPDMIGVGASDDMFLKIVAELKEKGVWEEDQKDVQDAAQEKEQVEQWDTAQKKERENGWDEVQKKEREERQEEIQKNERENGRDEVQRKEWEKEQSADVLTAQRQQELIEKGLRAEQQEQELKERKARRAKKMKRVIRRGSAAAAMVAVVFGVGMTSEANRRLVFQAWDNITGNLGLRMATDYVDEEKIVRSRTSEEVEDAKLISEELGISSIDLVYLPEGMEYLRYEIDKAGDNATMFYSYEDKIFMVKMLKSNVEGVAYYSVDDESKLMSLYTADQEIEARIGILNSNGEMETYVAQMEFEGCSYVLNGMLPLEEMKKIIEKIYFL